MNTELIFGASFKIDTPIEVINTIRYLAGDIDEPENILWNFRVNNPLRGYNTSFPVELEKPKMYKNFSEEQWVLSSRANIKNHNNDIESFLCFVKPYIDEGSGIRNMYAIVIYQESSEPTIYYLEDV